MDELMETCNQKVRKLIKEDLKMKVYIEDRRRIKNICFFCKKKCSGC